MYIKINYMLKKQNEIFKELMRKKVAYLNALSHAVEIFSFSLVLSALIDELSFSLISEHKSYWFLNLLKSILDVGL